MQMDLVGRKIAEDKDLLDIVSGGEGYEEEGRAAAAIALATLAEGHGGEAALWLLMNAIELAASLDVPGYKIVTESHYSHPAGIFTA